MKEVWVTKVLIITILVEMYSLGIVTTALMFCDERGIYLGLSASSRVRSTNAIK